MKICMTAKSVNDFTSFFKTKAQDILKQNPKITTDDMYRALYTEALSLSNDVSSQENKDVVLQHLIYAPIALNSIGVNVGKDLSSTLNALNNVSELESLLQNYVDLINPELSEPVTIEYTSEEVPMSYAHMDLLTSFGTEFEGMDSSKIIEGRAPYFKAVRILLESLQNGGEYVFELTTLNKYPKLVGGPVFETVRNVFSAGNIPIIVVKNADGTNVMFDNTPLVFPMLNPKHVLTSNEYANAKDILTSKFNVEIAEEKLSTQMNMLNQIYALAKTNPAGVKVSYNPLSSTSGVVNYSNSLTPLSQVSNREGMTFINNKLTGGDLKEVTIGVSPNYIDQHQNIMDTIVSILTDDTLTDEDGFALDDTTKINLLASSYIGVSNVNGPVMLKDGQLYLHGIKAKNPKADLINFLTSYTLAGKLTENKVKDYVKQGYKVVSNIKDLGPKTIYKDGNVYRNVYKPKLSYSKHDKQLSIDNGAVVVKKSNVTDFVFNTASVNANLTANNELKVFHPKVGFNFTIEYNKSVEQKELNDKAETAAEDKALKWWNGSALSTIIGLNNAELNSEDRPENRHAVANFVGDMINLFKGSDNTDIYHEAWHAFSQGILTKQDKKSLYDYVRKENSSLNDATDLEVEEYLAEEFRAYAIAKGNVKVKNSKIKKFFEAIYNFLKKALSKYSAQELNMPSTKFELINSMFDKLYTNDFNISDYNQKNFIFPTLNKSITVNDTDILNSQQVSLLIQTMDSLLADYVSTNSGISFITALKSSTGYVDAYTHVKNKLQGLLDETSNKILSTKNPIEIQSLQNIKKALQIAVDNLILDDIKALSKSTDFNTVKMHLQNSNFFTLSSLKDAVKLDDAIDVELSGSGKVFEKAGNEQSLFESLDEEVLQLLSTCRKYENVLNADGTYTQNLITNVLGVPVLESKVVVVSKLGKLLNSISDPDLMVKTLQDEAKNDNVIAEVVLRLGDYENNTLLSRRLWTKFLQNFHKANIQLKQFIIEKNIDVTDDMYDIATKFGSPASGIKAVQRDWDSSFNTSASPYISKNVNNEPVLDVESVVKDFIQTGTVNLLPGKSYIDFYKALGVNFTENTEIEKAIASNATVNKNVIERLREQEYLLKHLRENQKVTDTYEIKSLHDLFRGVNIVNADGNVVKGKSLDGYFKTLQKYEFDYSNKYNSFMALNAEGKAASELSLNSSLSEMVNELNASLKNGESLEQILEKPYMAFLNPKNNPMLKANHMFNSLFTDEGLPQDGPEGFGKRVLNYENFAGTSVLINEVGDVIKEVAKSGAANMNLDEVTKYITDIYLSYYNHSEIVRAADKTTSIGLNVSHYTNNAKNLFTASDALNIKDQMARLLLPYLAAEITRINTLKKDSAKYDKAVVSRGSEFIIFEGLLSKDVLNKLTTITATDFDTVRSEIRNLKVTDVISKNLNDYFNGLDSFILNKIDALPISTNVLRDLESVVGKELSDSEARDILVKMFSRNKFMHNLDFTTMFLGDPSNYKVAGEDFHKRLAGINSTGEMFLTDAATLEYFASTGRDGWAKKATSNKSGYGTYTGTLQTAIITDNEFSSAYLDEYTKVLTAIGNSDSGKYATDLNEADGQAYVSFDTFRMLAISQGIWTDEQESMYKAIVNRATVDEQGNVLPGTFDQSQVNDFFQCMKLQYFGPINSEGMTQTAFHKFNLVPLIPTLIKGTKLEALHNKMMSEGIDYVTHKSGSKGSNLGVNDIYNAETREMQNLDKPFVTTPIYTKYLKNQLKIASHFKGKVTLPTQERSIITLGLYENGKPVNEFAKRWLADYEGTFAKIREVNERKLLNDLGVKSVEDLFTDTKLSNKLANMIVNELDSKDYTQEQINFLFDNDGNLKSNLTTVLTADKIEKMFVSLVDKRMTRIKVNGEGLIQIASSMTESKTQKGRLKGSNELGYYSREGLKDGELTHLAECKIALQGDYKKLLHVNKPDGTKVTVYKDFVDKAGNVKKVMDYDATLAEINKLIKDPEWLKEHEELLHIKAPRIPSQMENSFEAFKIAEFLPHIAGNIVIMPTEVVVKAGSDYDVDKLFMSLPNLELYSGKIEKVKYHDESYDLDALSLEKSTLSKEKSDVSDKLTELYEKLNKINADYVPEVTKEHKEYNELKKQLDLYDKKSAEWQAVMDDINERKDIILNTYEMLADNKRIQAEQKDINAEITTLKDSIKEIDSKLNDVQRKISGKSVKGLENDLIRLTVERIRQPEYFGYLISPNSTGLLDPAVDKYRGTANDFNKYEDATNGTRTKKQGIAGSMIFNPIYNINKQLENAVGMDTLGIGAIVAKYYPLFVRMGLKLNTTNGVKDVEDKDYYPYVLNLKHNKTKEGNIDLSRIHNVKGIRIMDYIGQLINGWVDVAKDAWIFNIQGNKEVTPTLLFLTMAGVDVDDTIDFVSKPVIKEYIKMKREVEGPIATFNNLVRQNPIELLAQFRDIDDPVISSKAQLFKYVKELGELDINSADPYTLLCNYIASEYMGQEITNLTMATKFDTQTFSTLYDVVNAKDKFDHLPQENPALPADIKDLIKSTVLGPFESMNLQTNLWSRFFPLKMHPMFTLLSRSFAKAENKKLTMADKQKIFYEEFLSYVYQNESAYLSADFKYKGLELTLEPSTLDNQLTISQEDLDEFGNASYHSRVKYAAEKALLSKQYTSYDKLPNKRGAFMDFVKSTVDILPTAENYNEELYQHWLYLKASYNTGLRDVLFDKNYGYGALINVMRNKPKFKSLGKQFALVNDLSLDINRYTSTTNLYLPLINESGYRDMYTENLNALKQHTDSDINFIFNTFERFALLQSGNKSFGKYVLTDIIDQAALDKVIGRRIDTIVNELDAYKEGTGSISDWLSDFKHNYIYKENGEGRVDNSSYTRFIRNKDRGINYESDYLTQSLEAMDEHPNLTLDDIEGYVPEVLKKVVNGSNAIIAYSSPTGITKNSVTTRVREHVNSLSDSLFYKGEGKIIAVQGDAIDKYLYGKNEHLKPELEKELIATFNKNYKTDLDKGISHNATFKITDEYGINSMAIDYLKSKGYNAHKVIVDEGTYFVLDTNANYDAVYYHTQHVLAVDQYVPELALKNTYTIPTPKNAYNNIFHYVAAYKAKYSTEESVQELLKDKDLSKLNSNDWVTIIQKLKLKDGSTYTLANAMSIAVKKIVDNNVEFKNNLLSTGNLMLSFDNAKQTLGFYNKTIIDQYLLALMKVRNTLNDPYTVNNNPFMC